MSEREAWQGEVEAAVAGCTRVALAAAVAHVREAIAGGAAVVHAADLALAYAVAAGDPVAVRRFDERVGGELVAAARAIDRAPAFVDEICQQARVRLVVGDGGPPRIASYRGGGSLRAWAAMATRRLALNAKRGGDPADAGVEALAELVDREPDPELRHLRGLYKTELREALTAALAALDDRGRAVLRLRFVEGLELAQIGRVYRVHESTVSRWVTAAREQVAADARARLMARLGIATATADSVARMVASGLELSVARLLR